MRQVTELADYGYKGFQRDWVWAILLFGVGSILMFYQAFRDYMREYWILIICTLFLVSVIAKSAMPQPISGILALALFAAMPIWVFWATSRKPTSHCAMLLITLCCFSMLILTSGSVRYIFFLAPFAACAMAVVVTALSDWLKIERKWVIYLIPVLIVVQVVILLDSDVLLKVASGVLAMTCAAILFLREWRRRILVPLLAIVFLSLIIQIPGFGVYGGTVAVIEEAASYIPYPNSLLASSLIKIGKESPQDSVIVANWDKGSRINVYAQRATVVDEDHYIPYWIFLAYRHVFCAESEEEALQFLRIRGATHLLFCPGDAMAFDGFGFLGSDESFDRRSGPILYGRYSIRDGTRRIDISVPTPHGPARVVADYTEGQLAFKDIYCREYEPAVGRYIHRRFRRIYVDEEELTLADPIESELEEIPYRLLIFRDDNVLHFFAVHENAYDQLFTRLYVRNLQSEHFSKICEVFPEGKHDLRGDVFQLWKINYPEDLVMPSDLREEYMATDFLDSELYKDWYFVGK